MPFYKEPPGYNKTALSDLQGAWSLLKEVVIYAHPFPESHRMLFHIDEGMSWENVRDLGNMSNILVLIRNIATNANAPDDILNHIDTVREALDEVFAAIAEGENI